MQSFPQTIINAKARGTSRGDGGYIYMDKKLTDALGRNNLHLWTRDGKHYAVTDRHGHEAGVEHHVTEAEFEELKTLGAKVEHAPHEVNG